MLHPWRRAPGRPGPCTGRGHRDHRGHAQQQNVTAWLPGPVAMLWVNSLNSKGEAGGCLQVEGARKATVWKPGADEVIDAHAPMLLPDPSLKPSYASSVARLGDNGTTVGRLIAKRLTAPDQPAGPEDPEVDLPRDFVISPG